MSSIVIAGLSIAAPSIILAVALSISYRKGRWEIPLVLGKLEDEDEVPIAKAAEELVRVNEDFADIRL
jgi:type III secretory pathway component EscU